MRAERIIGARAEAGIWVSPLAVLLTTRIYAEWEIARDAVVFPEELVDLARIVQATLDEQRNLLSQATGRKNETMTSWWRITFLLMGFQALIVAAAWLIDWWRS